MTRHEMLYSRINLCNLPPDTTPQISDDYKHIYYNINNSNVLLTEIHNSHLDGLKQFMNFKLTTDTKEGWYKLMLELDTDKLKNCLTDYQTVNYRKLLFSILEKCCCESYSNYISQTAVSFIEGGVKENNESFLNWALSKERSSNISYFCYPSNTVKIDDLFVDTANGHFLQRSEKIKVNMKGGLIVDKNNYHWISEIALLIKCNKANINEFNMLIYQHTPATLIICQHSMCALWKNKLTANGIKTVVINSKQDHYQVNYKSFIDNQVIIVSSKFIVSKNYTNLWDQYILNDNMDICTVMNIMKEEFQLMSNPGAKTSPVFSMIKWHRLIIDNASFSLMEGCTKTKNLHFTIHSDYRWMQLKEIPFKLESIVEAHNFLSDNPNINFPIYKRPNKCIYFNSLLFWIDYGKKYPKVESETVEIQMDDFEKYVHKYCGNFDSVYNSLLKNIDKYPIISQTREKELQEETKCVICASDFEHKTITSCGHPYCLDCILRVVTESKSCPLCRKIVTYSDLYCTEKRTDLKLESLNTILTTSLDQKMIIYVKDAMSVKTLGKKIATCHPIECCGSIQKKLDVIEIFNKSGHLIIMQMDDIDLSKNLKNIRQIVFWDISTKLSEKLSAYCGEDYLNSNIDKIKVVFFVIKN